MKKKRFAVEQIVAILKQVELGIPVVELIRQVGVSEQTFYRWKKRKEFHHFPQGPSIRN